LSERLELGWGLLPVRARFQERHRSRIGADLERRIIRWAGRVELAQGV